MPKFVNKNAHRVSVRDQDQSKPRHRLTPGQVLEADGYLADVLSKTAGVETATDADEKAYNERGRSTTAGESRRLKAKARIGDQRNELRRYLTVGPLQVVVGDDLAPHGPPSGVVTTKQAVAAGGGEDREAYAENEALSGEKVDVPELNPLLPRHLTPTGEQIHNRQVTDSENAEAAAKQNLADRPGGGGQAKAKATRKPKSEDK